MSGRAALVALTVALLGGCGGGSGDEDAIRGIVDEGSKDPAAICDNLTRQGLKDIGGMAQCRQLAKSQDNTDPNVVVHSVQVDGDKATAKVTGKDGDQTIRFVKEDGAWKVSPG
jgi:hypothetical protein